MAAGQDKLQFILSLQDRLSAPLKSAQRQIHALSAGVNRATNTITSGFLLGTGAVFGLMGALRPAIEFQRSLGEIRAMGVGPSGLKALEEEAFGLSNQFGISARSITANARAVRTEFGAMADSELIRVTRAATLMGKALNLANPVQVLDSAMDKLRHAELTLGLKLTDSKGAGLGVTDVIEKLRARFGKIDTAQEEMWISKAFGRGTLDPMKFLVNNAELLRADLKDIAKMDLGAALAVNPFDRLVSSADNLIVKWGSFLLPLLNPWIELLTSAAQRMQLWRDKFPNLTRALGLLVVGTLLLAVGIAALKIAWGGLMLIWTVGTFLGLLNPVFLVIAGIVALGLALAWVIKHWDDLKAAAGAAVDWILGKWRGLVAWFEGPGTLIGKIIALYTAPLAPGITVPDAQFIGGGGFSIPKGETVPGSAAAVSNIANSSDNRRSVNVQNLNVRTNKFDRNELQRMFALQAAGG